MALLSKISSLPRLIREEINRRLDEGQKGPEILEWVNAQPSVLEILEKRYQGVEVSDQNLSNWRETGYAEWQTGMQRVYHLQRLSEFATRQAASGSRLFGGASSIAAGHLMEVLETLDLDDQKELLKEHPETFIDLLDKLARLHKSQADAERTKDAQERTKLAKSQHAMAQERLVFDREKFEVTQVNAVLKYAKSPEIQAILKGNGSNTEKIKALRARMFPTRPPALEQGTKNPEPRT